VAFCVFFFISHVKYVCTKSQDAQTPVPRLYTFLIN
jgi:hypothetical protein